METKFLKAPLIVIVGPTASGKTALAIEIALKYGGVIICADSRTIYRELDLGTAKPSIEEQGIVKHHGLDILNPGEYFSASDFKKYANEKIQEIRSRGKIPFLVGGTGLYIDSVIFDYSFGSGADVELRQKLDRMTINDLHKIYNEMDMPLPENKLNKRYLVRGIERSGSDLKRKHILIDGAFVVGIATEKSILRQRIANRSMQIFNNGVIEEAKNLSEKYGWDSEAMTGNIYKIIRRYLNGEITENEMYEKNTTADWHLAKRQLTWFRRNQYIKWGDIDSTRRYLIELLEKTK